MRCSRCGYIDNRSGIYYCPQCGGSFGRGLGRLSASTSTSQSTQLAVQFGPGPAVLAVRQAYDASSYPAAIQRVYQERYRAVEALNQGNPFWEPFLKHIAAYRALQKAKEYLPIQDDLQKQAYVKYHQQEVEMELARQREEQNDIILRDQLLRRSVMLAEVMGYVAELFSSGPMASLPDEVKTDLMLRFYQQAEQWVFTHSMLLPPTATPPRLPNNGITVIDADEF